MKKFGTLLICLAISGLMMEAQTPEILTLNQALEQAYQTSPSLLRSKISLGQSEAALVAREAMLKSQFNLSVNPLSFSRQSTFEDITSQWYSYQTTRSSASFSIRQPIEWTDGTLTLSNDFSWQDQRNLTSGLTNTSFNNQLYLRLEQPIFTYNTTKLALKELEYALENSKLNYALQQLSIEKMVTRSFYQVYTSYSNLNIAEEEYANQKLNCDIIREKVNNGLIAKEELFQAELNLATSESSLYDAQTNYENTKDQFKQTIGYPIDFDFTVLPDISVNPLMINQEEAINFALQQRMELRQMQINIESGMLNLVEAKATNEFRGSISAQVGISAIDGDITRLFSQPEDSESVGISLTIPIYDWGTRKATIKRAELGNESSAISMSEERISIQLEVRQICRNLPKLQKQIEIADQKVKNAEMTYSINTEKYYKGDITGMDLQQYQTQLSSAKQSYTSALISYKEELLNLKIQTLWDFEKGVSYLPVDLLK